MQFQKFISAAALIGFAIAAPAANVVVPRGDVVAQWNFKGTSLSCPNGDNAACTWQLVFDKLDGNAPSTCTFSTAGRYAGLQPEQNCNESNLLVSMNYAGFWAFALKDIDNRLISFPGFNNDDFAASNPITNDKYFNVERLNL